MRQARTAAHTGSAESGRAGSGTGVRIGEPESWDLRDYARAILLPRFDDDKRSRGRVLIVGGAPGMTGAVCLAARSALRCGAGYVAVAVPGPSLPVVEMKLTEPVKFALPASGDGALAPEAVDAIVALADRADVIVLGPGIGRFKSTVRAVRALVERLELPLLLDADGLYAIGSDLDLLAKRHGATIVTPHEGEAARLLGLEAAEVSRDRLAAVRSLAPGRVTAVLKGPRTLVAQGGRVVANPSGGPGLATLGTGDVLAGAIGALLAAGMSPFDAAVVGTYVHGASGDLASAELSALCCTAGDVVRYLPEAIRPLLFERPVMTNVEDEMSELTARDIMTADPITVSPEASVTAAAHLMAEHRVGALPVVEGGAMIGLVTEGDLIVQDAKVHFPTYLSLLGGYIFAPGAADRFESSLRKAVGATVRDVMTPEPVTVTPDAVISDIATLLLERDVSRVPVVEGGQCIGIVSKSDIVRTLAG